MFGMSEDEFLRNQREMFFDKKYGAKLEAATAGGEAAEGAAEAADGGRREEEELSRHLPNQGPCFVCAFVMWTAPAIMTGRSRDCA